MTTKEYRAAVLTASDKGASGGRVDESGPVICEMLEEAGYHVVQTALLPDDRGVLADKMTEWCDNGGVDLILTTGGTGFSPRDCTPEATMDIAERMAPGISEAIRAHSMQITGRAMLSRAVSVLRKKTLVVNLPGSPKAVRESLEYVLPHLAHGLDILTGRDAECARREE